MSQPKDNRSAQPTAEESAVEIVLHQVLRATGRIVPLTEEEVAQAEALVNEDAVELSVQLRTPPSGPSVRQETLAAAEVTRLPGTQAGESLARAARNGARIPREVVERMKQDRESAENKLGSDD